MLLLFPSPTQLVAIVKYKAWAGGLDVVVVVSWLAVCICCRLIWWGSLLRLQPLLELAEGPDAPALVGRLGVDDASHTVLHAVDPLALVLATIRVGVRALTMLLVESIVALILAAILPDVVAESVHDAVLEGSLEVASIGPLEGAKAAHLVV